jgi:hypothetical protein
MKAWISAIFFILILIAKIANSQTMEDTGSLNFTYLGPVLSFGYNKVEYTDWFATSTETEKTSGYITSGGLAFNIFAYKFCGDIQIKYAMNHLKETLKYIEVSAAGKYFFLEINDYISLGGGLGIYLEIPAPNAKQNGSAGLQLPLTLLVDTTRDTKLFMDVYCRYGSFGIGTDTNSISVGTNIGFIFKVGRI